MDKSFSLASGSWVPVLFKSGYKGRVSLQEVFTRSDIQMVGGGVYGVQGEASMLRFLIHVSMASMRGRLPTVASVRTLIQDPAPLASQALSYLGSHASEFLLGTFMQVPGLVSWEASGGFVVREPVGKLLRDGKNNGVMSWRRDSEATELSPELIALGLVVQAAWSLNNPIGNGGATKEDKAKAKATGVKVKNGKETMEGLMSGPTYPSPQMVYPGPGAGGGCILHHVIDPRGLLHTMACNMFSDVELERDLGLSGGLGEDPWAKCLSLVDRVSFKGSYGWFENTFHGRYFGFSKALLVDFEKGEVIMAHGHKYTGGDHSMDSAYVGFEKREVTEMSDDASSKKLSWVPIQATLGKSLWRDCSSLLALFNASGASQGLRPPVVLRHDRLPDSPFMLKTYALSVKNTSGCYSCEHASTGSVTLADKGLFDPLCTDFRTAVIERLAHSEKSIFKRRGVLESVVKCYQYPNLSVPEVRKKSLKGTSGAAILEGMTLPLTTAYWNYLDSCSQILFSGEGKWDETVEASLEAAMGSLAVLESPYMKRALAMQKDFRIFK